MYAPPAQAVSVAITSTGQPAARSPSRASSVRGPSAERDRGPRKAGGEIDVTVLSGLAASHRAERPHLTRPGQRINGPASNQCRRNRPDLGQRHRHNCHPTGVVPPQVRLPEARREPEPATPRHQLA